MSSAVISVPTTASRFALLQIDSDTDSDPDAVKAKAAGGGGAAGKARSGKASGAKTSHGTADKKREKKKRRKEQQQSEANELRSLAFKKLPQRSSAAPAGVSVSVSAVQRDPQPEEGWTEWKQRDEQLTSDLYQADLEKALMLSKLEFEQQKNDPERSGGASPRGKTGGKKERKKNPRVTVSLTAFQQDGEIRGPERQERKQEDTRFFNQLQTDVTQTLQRDRLREHSSGPEEAEQDVRTEQLKYDLEKKEEEIQKLKLTISQWEERYKEVKARNAQLLKMLQQGEMKDKAEILLQVQELLGIKGELSSQVAQLHTALEQERSKVKGLQAEQPKHQGNRKSKKAADGAS